MVWLTFSLAIFAALSVWIFYLQLDEMHRTTLRDQRAWIEAAIEKPEIVEGKPISATFMVSNIGKTAAREIRVEGIVEVVPGNKAPNVGTQFLPATRVTMGVMFPTSGKIVDEKMQAPIGMLARFSNPHTLSHDEFIALLEGRTYVAVHGQVTFLDIFRTHHWLHFCSWHSIAPLGHQFESEECVNYNDTDND